MFSIGVSDLIEVRESILLLSLELLVVAIVGKTRLDTSFDHLEISLFQGIWDISLGVDLLHLLVNNSRLVASRVQERASHLGLEEFVLTQGFLGAFFLVGLDVEFFFFGTQSVVCI